MGGGRKVRFYCTRDSWQLKIYTHLSLQLLHITTCVEKLRERTFLWHRVRFLNVISTLHVLTSSCTMVQLAAWVGALCNSPRRLAVTCRRNHGELWQLSARYARYTTCRYSQPWEMEIHVIYQNIPI